VWVRLMPKFPPVVTLTFLTVTLSALICRVPEMARPRGEQLPPRSSGRGSVVQRGAGPPTAAFRVVDGQVLYAAAVVTMRADRQSRRTAGSLGLQTMDADELTGTDGC
jgi:hypothetical protein